MTGFTITLATAATPAAFEVRVDAATNWTAPWWRRRGAEPLRLAWTPRGLAWALWMMATRFLVTLARWGVRQKRDGGRR